MHRLGTHSRARSYIANALPTAIALLLLFVVGALLMQQYGLQWMSGKGVTEVELLERLQAHEIQTDVMGPTVAPLTIRGTRVRLSGPALTQSAEVSVYEDVNGVVQIDDTRIVSQPIGLSNRWPATGRTDAGTTDANPTVIDVAAWPVPLHVFQQGQLIVLYPGNDPNVLRVLTEVVGKPVASPTR